MRVESFGRLSLSETRGNTSKQRKSKTEEDPKLRSQTNEDNVVKTQKEKPPKENNVTKPMAVSTATTILFLSTSETTVAVYAAVCMQKLIDEAVKRGEQIELKIKFADTTRTRAIDSGIFIHAREYQGINVAFLDSTIRGDSIPVMEEKDLKDSFQILAMEERSLSRATGEFPQFKSKIATVKGVLTEAFVKCYGVHPSNGGDVEKLTDDAANTFAGRIRELPDDLTFLYDIPKAMELLFQNAYTQKSQ